MSDTGQSHDVLLANVVQTGSKLGALATSISEVLEKTEAALGQMEGKVAAEVSSPEVKLSFERDGQWALWIEDDQCPNAEWGRVHERLTEASVARKARAYPLLNGLLAEIHSKQLSQLYSLQDALKLANPDYQDPDSFGWTAIDAKAIWQTATEKLGGLGAEKANQAHRFLVKGPNELQVRFPGKYNFCKEFCDKPEIKQQLTDLVSEVAKRPITLSFASDYVLKTKSATSQAKEGK